MPSSSHAHGGSSGERDETKFHDGLSVAGGQKATFGFSFLSLGADLLAAEQKKVHWQPLSTQTTLNTQEYWHLTMGHS